MTGMEVELRLLFPKKEPHGLLGEGACLALAQAPQTLTWWRMVVVGLCHKMSGTQLKDGENTDCLFHFLSHRENKSGLLF